MSVQEKLEILKNSFQDSSEFDQVLDKLFDIVLSSYYEKRKKYEQELKNFESKYQLDSDEFYRRFESGELGDDMDFFEWVSLIEMQEKLGEKISQLESVI
jgi:hypothetical protein